MKTRKQIGDYVKEKKGSFVSLGRDRWGKDRIYFKNKETGRFTGNIIQDKVSISAVKKYLPTKAKIKVKFKGERQKKTILYNIYNKEQRDTLLFRMNNRLRGNKEYKENQENIGNPSTKFRDDAVPVVSKEKKKVDLLFDKTKFEKVDIEEYTGYS